MSRQSRPSRPVLLLTRPAAQNARFAEQMAAAFAQAPRVVDSPLLASRFLDPPLPPGRFAAIAFTSETGVAGFRRLSAETGWAVWCVGPQTARAARQAGFATQDGGGDAKAMAERILATQPRGPVLIVRGREQAVDLAALLHKGGVLTQDLVVYAQDLQPLADAAREVFASDADVVAPLFSARTAAHFSALPEVRGRRCLLFVAALSPAVAAAAAPARPEATRVAARPDADGLIAALQEWCGTERQP